MIEFLCTLAFISSISSICEEPRLSAVGFVEGEYVLVAPIETAQILSVDVRRGDKISENQPLVHLEKQDVEIAILQAEAAIEQAKSKLANLQQGSRPEEIAVIEASLASAKIQVLEAKRVFQRQSDLLKRGITSRGKYDTASTNLEIAKSKIDELVANLAVAKLPARIEEVKAATASVKQAEAVLENAQWRLGERTLSVPKSGIVVDIIRHSGEVAGPQAPVISILPDDGLKLRFYVPQRLLSRLNLGRRLDISCDGCGPDLSATIVYISPDPEFTPPVIYSLKNRQKLVYMVEARPDKSTNALNAGQIVDVDLESIKP
jgi:HlyD family secretion protein